MLVSSKKSVPEISVVTDLSFLSAAAISIGIPNIFELVDTLGILTQGWWAQPQNGCYAQKRTKCGREDLKGPTGKRSKGEYSCWNTVLICPAIQIYSGLKTNGKSFLTSGVTVCLEAWCADISHKLNAAIVTYDNITRVAQVNFGQSMLICASYKGEFRGRWRGRMSLLRGNSLWCAAFW